MTDGTDSAGASARREYERRRATWDGRIRAKWGRLGGIAVALSDEPQNVTAWRTGATGEERVGAALDKIAGERFRVLHDRRIGGTRANIDHIVVSPAGVWVIDTKRYKGRPRLRVEGGVFRPRTEKLIIGGRDKSALVDGVIKQARLVRLAVGATPVRSVLCFVDADWPLIGGSFDVQGVGVFWPTRMVARITRATDAGIDVGAVATAISETFPPA
jgi:hypothetical protein